MSSKTQRLVWVLVCLIFNICSAQLSINVTKGQPLPETEMRDLLATYKVPGISIAVIDDFEIDWVQGYGIKSLDDRGRVTELTLFQAASISKPISALGALLLVEQGELNLDANINESLVSWAIPENTHTDQKPVTLKGLLNHSAGLNVHGFAGYKQGNPLPTLQAILEGDDPANSRAITVLWEPEFKWSYSGGGYVILQLLIEDISNKTFADYMQETVLKPLDMNNSSFSQPLAKDKRQQASSGHTALGKVLAGEWHVYPELAAAGLWTTPTDIAKFIIDVQLSVRDNSNKVLSQEMMREFLTPQMGNWGLGIGLERQEKTIIFSHGGSNAGFQSLFIADLRSGQGIVAMTNSDLGPNLIGALIDHMGQTYGWSFSAR